MLAGRAGFSVSVREEESQKEEVKVGRCVFNGRPRREILIVWEKLRT